MLPQRCMTALASFTAIGFLSLATMTGCGGQPTASSNPTNAPAVAPTAAGSGEQITNSIGMKLTLVPSGEFMMGCAESAEESAAFFKKNYDFDLSPANPFAW